jgi:hypothetical protein
MYINLLGFFFHYTMPDKVEYLNTIHSIHSPCMIYYQKLICLGIELFPVKSVFNIIYNYQ